MTAASCCSAKAVMTAASWCSRSCQSSSSNLLNVLTRQEGTNLLGSLLLLLLLLLGALVLFRFGSGLDNRFRFGLLLLLLLLGDKEAEHLLGLDHVVLIDVELAKHIVDLGLGHLVAPGLEGVLEDLDVDLALGVVGLEGLHNHVIGVVALSGHLLLEHLDHVVIGAGPADLAEQAVQLTLGHQHADVVEGAAEIVFVDGAVLVDVHQLEAVLVHVKLLLGETSLILALAHGEKRCVESLLQYS